jgi:hypothetical protein
VVFVDAAIRRFSRRRTVVGLVCDGWSGGWRGGRLALMSANDELPQRVTAVETDVAELRRQIDELRAGLAAVREDLARMEPPVGGSPPGGASPPFPS